MNMPELKKLLERADRAVSDLPMRPNGFERLVRRRHRQRRNQRITAGVLGTVVALAAIYAGSSVIHTVTTPAVSPTPTATASDTFAGVHGWIIYRTGSDIMAVDPSSPDNTIPFAPAMGSSPLAWSQDGGQLLLEADGDLYVLKSDGSRARVTYVGGIVGGALSPDGTQVVYASKDGRLFVGDTDGGNFHLLAAPDTDKTWLLHPAWSPDSSRIAFISSTRAGQTSWGEAVYSTSVLVVDADGTNRRVLADLGQEGGWADSLAWSPDGSQLALADCCSSGGDRENAPDVQIYLVAGDGSAVQRLTDAGMNRSPTWSPDGTKIAFECADRAPGGSYRLCIMAADGSDLQRVDRFVIDPGGGRLAWNPVE